jgi:hypothetical protein
MSFNLVVWYSDQKIPDEKGIELYKKIHRGQTDSLTPNKNIEKFFTELTSRYAPLEEVLYGDVEHSVWACAFDKSDRHVVMFIRADGLEKSFEIWKHVATTIVELANKHGLICFDPQASAFRTTPYD